MNKSKSELRTGPSPVESSDGTIALASTNRRGGTVTFITVLVEMQYDSVENYWAVMCIIKSYPQYN